MKFKSDDEKRQFMVLLAKDCAKHFKDSEYPSQAFNFPFLEDREDCAYPIIELHIRIPASRSLPAAIKPPEGYIPTKAEQLGFMRDCPAIENIQLRPEFQRMGFLNAFMKELAVLGIPYVNISNIENASLATHYLKLSRCKGSGVELTSRPHIYLGSATLYPTFSINLRERYIR